MKRPFIIVIGGGYRTGSVWQYNAVRLLLEAAGKTLEWGDWRGSYRYWDRLPSCDVLLIKEHHFCGDLSRIADMVFTTERDWDDAEESWYRFDGRRLNAFDTACRKSWLSAWKVHVNHVCHIEFEEMKAYPRACFDLICTAMEDVIDPGVLYLVADKVFARLQALKPPKVGQDETTMLFHNHITRW